MAFRIAEEREGAVNSVARVLASVILLVGFLAATTGTQVVDKKTLTVDGAKRVKGAAVVEARRVNAANSFGAATPAEASSCSCGVTYFNSEKVRAASTPDSQKSQDRVNNVKRGDLFDWDAGENKYQVRITRQEKGDKGPQVHTFRHIFYVLEGSATFVTGGTLVAPEAPHPSPVGRVPAPDTPGAQTITGRTLEGGETRHLSKGDLITVPKGVPHWWKEVTGSPLIYIVINFVGAQGHDFSVDPGVVTYFNSEKVSAGFTKGSMRPDGKGGTVLFDGKDVGTKYQSGGSILFEGKGVGNKYQVITVRGASDEAEVHTLDSDVIYVLEGTATFVTGGTVVDPRTTQPNEIRGTAIEGGVTRHLSKGDLLVMSKGTPFWYKETRGPLLRLLVKIR